MPNWCEGNIRFRGKMRDILKLIENQFMFCKVYVKPVDKYSGQSYTEEKPSKVTLEDDYLINVSTPFDDTETTNRSYCYIEGTRRNFMSLYDNDFDSTVIYKLPNKEDDYIVVFDKFSAAWSIEPEPYVEMSKKYHVDIRIMGWEQGLGFWQDIVIVDGKIIRNVADDYGGYDGWMWESALPYVGG